MKQHRNLQVLIGYGTELRKLAAHKAAGGSASNRSRKGRDATERGPPCLVSMYHSGTRRRSVMNPVFTVWGKRVAQFLAVRQIFAAAGGGHRIEFPRDSYRPPGIGFERASRKVCWMA